MSTVFDDDFYLIKNNLKEELYKELHNSKPIFIITYEILQNIEKFKETDIKFFFLQQYHYKMPYNLGTVTSVTNNGTIYTIIFKYYDNEYILNYNSKYPDFNYDDILKNLFIYKDDLTQTILELFENIKPIIMITDNIIDNLNYLTLKLNFSLLSNKGNTDDILLGNYHKIETKFVRKESGIVNTFIFDSNKNNDNIIYTKPLLSNKLYIYSNELINIKGGRGSTTKRITKRRMKRYKNNK